MTGAAFRRDRQFANSGCLVGCTRQGSQRRRYAAGREGRRSMDEMFFGCRRNLSAFQVHAPIPGSVDARCSSHSGCGRWIFPPRGHARTGAIGCHSHCGGLRMKLAGLLLLPAGWLIVISALVLFPSPTLRLTFVLVGLFIQAGGLVIAFSGSKSPRDLGG